MIPPNNCVSNDSNATDAVSSNDWSPTKLRGPSIVSEPVSSTEPVIVDFSEGSEPKSKLWDTKREPDIDTPCANEVSLIKSCTSSTCFLDINLAILYCISTIFPFIINALSGTSVGTLVISSLNTILISLEPLAYWPDVNSVPSPSNNFTTYLLLFCFTP